MKTDNILPDDDINFPVDECIEYAEDNEIYNYDCAVCPLKASCPVLKSIKENDKSICN